MTEEEDTNPSRRIIPEVERTYTRTAPKSAHPNG